MEIKFRISELDYGTAAVSLLPMLCGKLAGQDGVKGKLCELLCQIPPQQLGVLINAVQPSTINQLLAIVLDSRKDGLLTMADSALRKKGLPVSLQDISLSSELELKVNADVDDYGELFSKLLISEDTGSLKSAVFGGTGKC